MKLRVLRLLLFLSVAALSFALAMRYEFIKPTPVPKVLLICTGQKQIKVFDDRTAGCVPR